MKLIVVHDPQGAIKSLGFASPQRTGIGVKPGPGQHVSIVEIADVEHAGHLAKYATGHRIDVRGGRPALVKN